MLVYLFIVVYLVIKAQKMAEGSLDGVASYEESTDYEKEGQVYMRGMMPFVEVNKGEQTREMIQFISFKVIQFDHNL